MAEAAKKGLLLDDCWNRIGVWAGRERSCPKLTEFIHCRNCPVYISAGRMVLDQEMAEEGEGPIRSRTGLDRTGTASGDERRMMVFRLGEEWFGLSLEPVSEVLHRAPVHRLPHRPDAALLGLANIKGNLTVVVDLAELLGVKANGKSRAQDGERPVFPRLVLIGNRARALAFPVDEVAGIERFAAEKLGHIPGTVDGRGMSLVQGLIHLGGRTIGVLNHHTLIEMMTESLR